MQPSRRWILGGLGLLVAAPSIVRASSLMTMPRAPVWVPPSGLWVEVRHAGKVVDRLPAVLGFDIERQPNLPLDVMFRVRRSMLFDEVTVHDGGTPLLSHRHHNTLAAANGMSCRLLSALGAITTYPPRNGIHRVDLKNTDPGFLIV